MAQRWRQTLTWGDVSHVLALPDVHECAVPRSSEHLPVGTVCSAHPTGMEPSMVLRLSHHTLWFWLHGLIALMEVWFNFHVIGKFKQGGLFLLLLYRLLSSSHRSFK